MMIPYGEYAWGCPIFFYLIDQFTHFPEGNFTGTGPNIWLPHFPWAKPKTKPCVSNGMYRDILLKRWIAGRVYLRDSNLVINLSTKIIAQRWSFFNRQHIDYRIRYVSVGFSQVIDYIEHFGSADLSEMAAEISWKSCPSSVKMYIRKNNM